MLNIKNLHASVEGKEILNGLNLQVNPGEVLRMKDCAKFELWCFG